MELDNPRLLDHWAAPFGMVVQQPCTRGSGDTSPGAVLRPTFTVLTQVHWSGGQVVQIKKGSDVSLPFLSSSAEKSRAPSEPSVRYRRECLPNHPIFPGCVGEYSEIWKTQISAIVSLETSKSYLFFFLTGGKRGCWDWAINMLLIIKFSLVLLLWRILCSSRVQLLPVWWRRDGSSPAARLYSRSLWGKAPIMGAGRELPHPLP